MTLTIRFSGITRMLGGLAAGSLALVLFAQAALGSAVFTMAPNPPPIMMPPGRNDVNATPEPGTMALFGLGMIGIGMIGRRRGRRNPE